MKRPRTPAGLVPNGAGILTGFVDVHQDRLEYQIEAWGVGEENWTVLWQAFYGDTLQEQVWLDLDTAIREPLLHESGQRVRVSRVGVDAGYRSDMVYRFARPRWPIVVAMKGRDDSPRDRIERQTAKTIVGRPNPKGNRYRCNLFPMDTDAAKDRVMARLRIQAPGPGYMHFNDALDEEWFEQLTAEKKVRQTYGFNVIWSWKKIRERNEALDLKVGNLAALYSMGEPALKSIGQLAAKMMEKVDPERAKAAPAKRAVTPKRAAKPWVRRW